MVIVKKSLPRRTFLRGLGTVVALPFLESMLPAMTTLAQTSAKPPLRFGAVYLPNGCTMDYWMPKTTDGSLEITPVLKPLEPFRNQMTVINNLSRAGGRFSTDHAVSSAALADRRFGETDRSRGYPRGGQHRPVAGEARGPGHAISLSRIRD